MHTYMHFSYVVLLLLSKVIRSTLKFDNNIIAIGNRARNNKVATKVVADYFH